MTIRLELLKFPICLSNLIYLFASLNHRGNNIIFCVMLAISNVPLREVGSKLVGLAFSHAASCMKIKCFCNNIPILSLLAPLQN